MKYCNLEQVADDIKKQIKDKTLIPILGSGFTVGSNAFRGSVPSGREMLKYMREKILKADSTLDLPDSLPFSKIALYYHKLIPKNEIIDYLKFNFTDVSLASVKKKFLEIDWIYIYTLNVDDAIEKSTSFEHVIVSNKDVNFEILADKKCVIKLHGDANSYITYTGDDSKIFDFKQYAKSLEKNKSLLNKLRHDFLFKNLLYIGCSLDDEVDLITLDGFQERIGHIQTSKYYVTREDIGKLKELELEQFGITHVIKVSNYEEFYDTLHTLYLGSKTTQSNEIDDYKNFKILNLPPEDLENHKYLYFNKQLFNKKENQLVLPSFFIERQQLRNVLANIEENTIHIIHGHRVTGKSYFLAAIKKNIINKDVYLFDSTTIIPSNIVDLLLQNRNSVFLFDSGSLKKDAVFNILNHVSEVKRNKNNVIFAINNSDKDIISHINSEKNKIKFKSYNLSQRIKDSELEKLNTQLGYCSLPTFSQSKTILDNLITASKVINANPTCRLYEPQINSERSVRYLILLASKEKLYTKDLIDYDILEEAYTQASRLEPTICKEYTLALEKNIENSSDEKFILNAKFWLYDFLGQIANIPSQKVLIIDAYYEIVKTLLNDKRRSRQNQIVDFIKFDIINEIFRSDFKGQIGLIKDIYRRLASLLSGNAHFCHQHAKCYLWHSHDRCEDLEQLLEARKLAALAKHNFLNEYEKSKNEKVLISIAHVKVTEALICAKTSYIKEHSDLKLFKETVTFIYDALYDEYIMGDIDEIKKKPDRKVDYFTSIIDKGREYLPTLDHLEKEQLQFITNKYLLLGSYSK